MHVKFRALMTEWRVRKYNVSQVTKVEIQCVLTQSDKQMWHGQQLRPLLSALS
jgi:hypothetical protein